ncbi:MAG: TlpA family protein disulfide reductase [Desulfovibrio sp.]|uniref:TlpA family protein disulfide reductase n=1 Tax=Desulfovibrio sp. 7SRBS1 TaxID=3378064 RepID=UPI003B3E668E
MHKTRQNHATALRAALSAARSCLLLCLPLCILWAGCITVSAFAAEPEHTPVPDSARTGAGTPLAQQKFQVPEEKHLAEYLGLKTDGEFTITDLRDGFILLQLFNVYCPHCQAEAARFSGAWDALSSPPLVDRVVFLAVGVGNSRFEVNLFRDKYHLRHPMVLDPEYALYDSFGSPGTPTYVLLKKNGKKIKLIWQHTGSFKTMDKLLDAVRDHLKE